MPSRPSQAPPTPRTPKPAQVRLDRFASTTSHTSLLSVSSAYGLRSAGFDALGDVMGCVGSQFRYEYVGRCTSGSIRPSLMEPRVVLSDGSGAYRLNYARQLRGVYATALDRLRAEAVALGADGVVGIDLSMRMHGDLREVVAVGTAVRAAGKVRPTSPFLTDLSGPDVAALLLAGWVPVGLHPAVQLGLRHNDVESLTQAGAGISKRLPNAEVTGWSELMQRTQQGAEKVLRRAVTAAGADGALLSTMTTRFWSHECARSLNSSDQVACTVAIGTSIARVGGRRAPAPRALTILPVGGPR